MVVTDGLRLIGLTGGIGTGKSTVARLIAARGVPVIDADTLAREAVQPGSPGLAAIASAWPDAMAPDGSLDRGRLGRIVFSDRAARARLEAMLHPRIAELADARVRALARAGHRLAFYEASLLVETGRHRDMDGLVVVDAPEPERIARVMRRDGLTAAEVGARLAAQAPVAEKRRVATRVIENGGDLASLSRQVDELLADLTSTGVPDLPPGD
jgi:dephospho-CoA kinase